MAAKRITITMAEEAASEMTQPIKDHIALLRRKASNIIKAEYLKSPKYAYLEEVGSKYTRFFNRVRNARLTYMTLCLDWTLTDDCRLIAEYWENRTVIPCTEETIRVVDRISLEIEEAKKDHEKTYKSIGDAILKCGNMRVLKKDYPEAYKVLEAYDTESPKSKTNTALQLPLESINKILSKYEKDN